MTQVLGAKLIDAMHTVVPNAKCELNHQSPYQLLVAVVLSAQCTDIRVNMVTAELFARAATPEQMVTLSENEMQGILKSLGFFRAKAKSVLTLSQQLLDKYNGQVPSTEKELVELAGVGRKTANVILMECFDQPTIAVDTHVYRVSRRLGLSKATTPDGVEQDLYKNLPKDYHKKAHHTILHFGRYYCKAQRPQCDGCVVSEYCTGK